MWSCFTWKYEEKGFYYKSGLVLHGNVKGFYYKYGPVLHGNMKRRISATNVVLFYMEI